MNTPKTNTAQPIHEDISLALYLKQICHIKPLTSEKETATAKQIRKGDRRALHKMVRANLRFVVSVAKNYQNQGMSLSDLINEGNVGLIRAARRFDENRGFKFISYAVWWIRQAMLTALADHSRIVKIPLNRVSAIHKVGIVTRKLEQKLERHPSLKEIANKMGIEEEEAREAANMTGRHVSIDAPLQEGQDGHLLDFLQDETTASPDASVGEVSIRAKVESILDTLTPKEAEIVRLYFGIGHDTHHTLEEIGARFHLTRERIRQIKGKAISRLRHCSRNTELRTCFQEFMQAGA